MQHVQTEMRRLTQQYTLTSNMTVFAPPLSHPHFPLLCLSIVPSLVPFRPNKNETSTH